MKRLKMYLALAVVMGGFSLFGLQSEAKADSKTLHGIADIIDAIGGRGDVYYYDGPHAYYDPYPYRHRYWQWGGSHRWHHGYDRHHYHHGRDCD